MLAGGWRREEPKTGLGRKVSIDFLSGKRDMSLEVPMSTISSNIEEQSLMWQVKCRYLSFFSMLLGMYLAQAN